MNIIKALGISLYCQFAFLGSAAQAESVSHGDHHAESSSGLPQLDVSTFPSQLFWLAIAFAVLYFIFSKKSLPEISNTIENRHQHIKSDLDDAESLKEDAEKAQHDYESSLIAAKADAVKTLHDMQEQLMIQAEKNSQAFRTKMDSDIKSLEKDILQAKENAMEEMNVIAAEVAREAAKKIVGINADLEQAKTVVESLNNPRAKAA